MTATSYNIEEVVGIASECIAKLENSLEISKEVTLNDEQIYRTREIARKLSWCAFAIQSKMDQENPF